MRISVILSLLVNHQIALLSTKGGRLCESLEVLLKSASASSYLDIYNPKDQHSYNSGHLL